MFVGVLLVVFAAALGWISWRLGGVEGFQREVLVKGAITGVEQHLLNQRPDGVSESEIRAAFGKLHAAADDRRLDKNAFYQTLKNYETSFKGPNKRPSDGEVRDFLTALDKCALPSEATPSRDL
jgi:hypothetical protein